MLHVRHTCSVVIVFVWQMLGSCSHLAATLHIHIHTPPIPWSRGFSRGNLNCHNFLSPYIFIKSDISSKTSTLSRYLHTLSIYWFTPCLVFKLEVFHTLLPNLFYFLLWSSGEGQAKIGKGWPLGRKASKLKPEPRAYTKVGWPTFPPEVSLSPGLS